MKKVIGLVVLAGVAVWSTAALASMTDVKLYKEAFPGAKIKCIDCHTAAIPKKDSAGLNAYGDAVMKQAGEEKKTTVEVYTAVGTVEDFSKK